MNSMFLVGVLSAWSVAHLGLALFFGLAYLLGPREREYLLFSLLCAAFSALTAGVAVEFSGPALEAQYRADQIAHAEGRYQVDGETRKRLFGEGHVALQYCDRQGDIRPEANPNGSIDSIAGIFGGAKRNILGLMPHPERRVERELGGIDGRLMLEAFLRVA